MNPLRGYGVSTPYRKPGKRWSLGFHTGVDFAAPEGTPIYSATPGYVVAANRYSTAYGYFTKIQWGGVDVWYCHQPFNAANVEVGDKVKAGQRIGSVGSTGNVTGPHLHLEVRVAGSGFAAGNFRNPIAAINYQPPKDDEMALSDEDVKRIARAVWEIDIIPIEFPVMDHHEIAKNPTWTAKGAIGKLLKRQTEIAQIEKRMP